MPFADVNDRQIYFEDTAGPGAPVLFCHGFLMDHEMFEPQVSALADEFRCITWDERGFGQTEARGPFTYWDSADDALALLSYLGIDAAFFVGMSQGGFISMRAALGSPHRVRGLALIDTNAGPEPEEARPAYEAMATEWLTNGPSESLTGVVAGLIMSPGYDHSRWIAKWQATPKEAFFDPFRALMDRDDLWDRVTEVVAPAIIFHGQVDASIPMETAQRLADELPNCEGLVRVPGAGHACNLSHPDEINGPLRAFLRRHA
ncbi:MAG TPA: alpha/beta hydrolase [Acidimicrobiales bacterium]|nr:alpha/beta hydrolase [Acidimicrobiales bacterium]